MVPLTTSPHPDTAIHMCTFVGHRITYHFNTFWGTPTVWKVPSKAMCLGIDTHIIKLNFGKHTRREMEINRQNQNTSISCWLIVHLRILCGAGGGWGVAHSKTSPICHLYVVSSRRGCIQLSDVSSTPRPKNSPRKLNLEHWSHRQCRSMTAAATPHVCWHWGAWTLWCWEGSHVPTCPPCTNLVGTPLWHAPWVSPWSSWGKRPHSNSSCSRDIRALAAHKTQTHSNMIWYIFLTDCVGNGLELIAKELHPYIPKPWFRIMCVARGYVFHAFWSPHHCVFIF